SKTRGDRMMQPSGKQYVVTRPLYSEDSFVEQYEKVVRKRKTLCDSKRAKNAALSLLPIIGWLKIYRVKEWLLSDIVSGISTGLVAVLQGLAYSLLASIPPWYGLFTAFFPVIIYFFLGTSRHISVGAFPVLSLMVGATVTKLVPDDGPPVNITGFEGLSMDQQRVIVAASVTFLMGVFQLALGLVQVGFIVMYLSDTLVSGFTTAAAVHILVSQLKFILQLKTLEYIFTQITDTNICDLVTALVVMVVVFVVKELNDRFKSKLPVPIPVLFFFLLKKFNIVINFHVNILPTRYESPMAPNLDIIQRTAVEAFPIAIVGFAVAFSVAKVYAVKHDYLIDGNQELIAFGVSNMFGATFKSFAASTALSRSAVQESTGGKTQVRTYIHSVHLSAWIEAFCCCDGSNLIEPTCIAGLLSAVIVMIVTLAIGYLLEPLQKVRLSRKVPIWGVYLNCGAASF
uniref:SLC26A/SulP transporter domain-containing protein n=1 Tax=Denticeps clupeoides TaxID=299321 RepID=A0AAY4DKR2_9TELE